MATNKTQQGLFLLRLEFMDIRQRRIASLASFSAAITELQLKLVHNINIIVLSHSLCSPIGPTKKMCTVKCHTLNPGKDCLYISDQDPFLTVVFLLVQGKDEASEGSAETAGQAREGPVGT